MWRAHPQADSMEWRAEMMFVAISITTSQVAHPSYVANK